jgi:hypothetical protein
MNRDRNTDRDDRNPMDVPNSEMNAEIKRVTQKLWDACFRDGGEPSTALTITRNARLQVLLSRQADEQTQRIVRLTKGLFLLTVALLIATLILAGIAWHTDERIRQIHEITKGLPVTNTQP